MNTICVDCAGPAGHPNFTKEIDYAQHRADRHQDSSLLSRILAASAAVGAQVLPQFFPDQAAEVEAFLKNLGETVNQLNADVQKLSKARDEENETFDKFCESTQAYMESINGHFASLDGKIADIFNTINAMQTGLSDLNLRVTALETKAPAQ